MDPQTIAQPASSASTGALARPAAVLLFPALLGLAWLLAQSVLLLSVVPEVLDGTFLGPDSYMRMVRVTELLQGEGWYDSTIIRSNAPFGDTLHWSRPFDLLLVLFALPPAPLLGFDAALRWTAPFISPLLQLACAAALAWAAAPVLSRERALLAAGIFLVQPALLPAFLPGRPDHHGFLVLVFVLALGWILRSLARSGATGPAAAAGAAAGLALWASLELATIVIVGLAGLALAWLIEGGAGRQRQNLAFTAGLSAVLAGALLVEYPPAALLSVAFDKVSIVHLSLALLAVVFWAATAAVSRSRLTDSRSRRLTFGVAGAALAATCLYLLFPKVIGGPMVEVDPQIRDIWLDRVSEMSGIRLDTPEGLRLFLTFFGTGLLGLPLLLHIFVRERGWTENPAWPGIALGILIALPLGLLHSRMAGFAALLLTLPLAELVGRALQWCQDIAATLPRALLRSLILATALGGGVAAAQLVTPAEDRQAAPSLGGACPLSSMAALLAESTERAPLTILTMPDYGPELLYRTPHAVIGTPYHRNGSGITDSHTAMTSPEPGTARRILEARGVDLVLLCPGQAEANFFRPRPEASTATPSLYDRLLADLPPAWLQAVVLPPELAKRFKLFSMQRRHGS